MTDATGRQAAADLVTHFLRDPSRYGHMQYDYGWCVSIEHVRL